MQMFAWRPLLLATALLALSMEALAVSEPCACGRSFLQVCGTDNNTYNNICMATKCAKVQVAYQGPCTANMKVNRKAVPGGTATGGNRPLACACPMIYKPVCGSDGKTYPSDCLFTRCGTPEFKVEIVSQGPCPDTQPEPQVQPTPVQPAGTKEQPLPLGTKDQPAAAKPAVQPAVEGVTTPSKPAACACPRIYKPVCGSDGKTYDNDCLFTRCRTPEFTATIASEGACKDAATGPATVAPKLLAAKETGGAAAEKGPASRLPLGPACACTMQYKPVCGDDGKTYGNDCLFTRCRTPEFKVKIAYEGPCN